MTCPTQLADAWRQRSGNDQARLIENHGPRRRAVPSPHRVTESGPSCSWTDFEAAVYAVEDEAEAADMDTATPAEIANYYESG